MLDHRSPAADLTKPPFLGTRPKFRIKLPHDPAQGNAESIRKMEYILNIFGTESNGLLEAKIVAQDPKSQDKGTEWRLDKREFFNIERLT